MSYWVRLFFDKSFLRTMSILDHRFVKYANMHTLDLIAYFALNRFKWWSILKSMRTSLLQKRLCPWLHPHITTWCRHLFTLTFSFFFLYWSVIDTDKLLFYPVLLLTYERPLAFNAIPARVRLHSHRLHDYFTPVSLLLLCLMLVSVCVCLKSCPSHLCVNVGRVDQYKKKGKNREGKKFFSSATA
jgi:hypothetical protein